MKRPRVMPFILVSLAGAVATKGVMTYNDIAKLYDFDWRIEQTQPLFSALAADDPEPAATEETPAGEEEASGELTETDLAAEPKEEIPEEIFAAIKEERRLLEVQRNDANQRLAEAELALEKLAVEQTRLSELKAELEALLARVEQSQTDDLQRLVQLYRGMKPKEAALIMDDLDIEVTVLVMSTMAERDAAPILARINPVRARAISKILLERSKLPGDQKLVGVRLE